MNKCKVCGKNEGWLINSKKFGMVLCRTHYMKGMRYNDPFKKTTKSPNDVLIRENYAEIVLRDSKCEETARTKVSLENLDNVKKHKWHLSSNGYVMSFLSNKKAILLHRYILGVNTKEEVDHINGDILDNRTENLRTATPSQNQWNKGKPKNNKSGVTGVRYSKQNKGWVSSITYKKKYIYLGTYKDIKDAIKVRKEAELKYRGKYVRDEEG